MLLTATSRQRVYQFRHEREGISRPTGSGPDIDGADVTNRPWGDKACEDLKSGSFAGGFYDADNDATEEDEAKPQSVGEAKSGSPARRIASAASAGDEEEEIEHEADKKRTKK